jgi:hypothetical protein
MRPSPSSMAGVGREGERRDGVFGAREAGDGTLAGAAGAATAEGDVEGPGGEASTGIIADGSAGADGADGGTAAAGGTCEHPTNAGRTAATANKRRVPPALGGNRNEPSRPLNR